MNLLRYTPRGTRLAGGALAAVMALGGCGGGPSSAKAGGSPSAAESLPAGDIPDSQVYVPYSPPGGSYSIKVPEGWARATEGTATVFTDKLNGIRLEEQPTGSAPTVTSVTSDELPKLKSAVPGFIMGKTSAVTRKAGTGVLITYGARSAADPVTGKSSATAVERYEFWRGGHEVIVTLSSAVGADNGDPWRAITDSLVWRI